MSDGATEGADGIRVELSVDGSDCPAATTSADCRATVGSVTRTDRSGDAPAVTEFTVPAGADPEADGIGDPVFETDEGTRYRVRCEPRPCLCDLIEESGCPVVDMRAERGSVYVTFYAPGVERVRDIVADARERFDGVAVRSLRQSGQLSETPIRLDADRLTDRQREVIETAYRMGYFDYPKGANAEEVAAQLEITPSTLAEHLAAAEGKLIEPLAEG